MPHNRLSVFFDRKPRHSKSTSDLSDHYIPDNVNASTQWKLPKRDKSKERLTVLQEYNFKPLPALPPAMPSTHSPRAPSQHRASTTPLMHPPDELFLRMIRRRSLDARLEEMRIEQTQQQRQQQYLQKNEQELDMRLAFASALPPTYFDLPPAYSSPQQLSQPPIPDRHPGRGRRDTAEGQAFRAEQDDFVDDDPLRVEIDETMAQYTSIRVTEPTPTDSPQPSNLVSPINDIDNMYLERRRQRRMRERQTIAPY